MRRHLAPVIPIAVTLLALAAGCDATPVPNLMAPPASPSAARAANPAVVAGPAVGASAMATTNVLGGDHIVLVDDPFGTMVGNAYAFSATRTRKGLASGRFDFTAVYQGVKVHLAGTVTCFTVSDNRARVGGVVTSTNFAAIPVGTSETWSVTTGLGPRGKQYDTASSFLGGDAGYAQAYCANGLPYAEQRVIGGSVVIVN